MGYRGGVIVFPPFVRVLNFITFYNHGTGQNSHCVCVFVCLFACVRVFVCLFACVRVFAFCVFVFVCLCLYACVFVFVFACLLVFVCLLACVCIFLVLFFTRDTVRAREVDTVDTTQLTTTRAGRKPS